VLYEMITGQLPFKSEYHDGAVYSILNENPQPVTGLRTGVPVEMERIIDKCLEKKASDRYQHMDELIVDLPTDAETWSNIGAVYRGDAVWGPILAKYRARILARAGEAGGALDEIERLLAEPSHFSVHKLRLDPLWDPIREQPRYKALLARYDGR
jgi:serine/threonine protein kinase